MDQHPKPVKKLTLEGIGCGCWYTWHLLAAAAAEEASEQSRIHGSNEAKKDKSVQNAVLTLIKVLRKKFFCIKCRGHLDEFCKLDPPEQYKDEPEGLFVHSWRAHNNANKVTSKPQIDYDEAKSMYFGDDASCHKACGAGDHTSHPQTSFTEGDVISKGDSSILPQTRTGAQTVYVPGALSPVYYHPASSFRAISSTDSKEQGFQIKSA